MPARVQQRAIDDPAVSAFLAARSTYLFQEPVWQHVLATLGHLVAYYCLEEDGRLRVVQPAVRMKLGFFRLLYCGVPYGGPVGDADRLTEFFEGLAETARGEGMHRIRVSHNCYDADLSALPHCQVQEHVQQVLSLGGRSEEEVWGSLKSRTRRDARLGAKRGVTIETADTPAARDALFGLYARTMQRNETFTVWRREMVERMWDLVVGPGRGEMLLARHEGEPLAGLVSLYSGKRCFYFLGASSGEKRTLCPNDAVIWEAIRRAIAHGCDDFDLMMASRDDLPLIEFKSKWGAERHAFRFYERDLSRIACGLWNVSFRIVRTRVGGRLVRLLRGQ